MFGAYDRGFEEGEQFGYKKGFNEAIFAAMKAISSSPLSAIDTEKIYQLVKDLMIE
jgi:hypothetical protein